jgi:hypothetical protein
VLWIKNRSLPGQPADLGVKLLGLLLLVSDLAHIGAEQVLGALAQLEQALRDVLSLSLLMAEKIAICAPGPRGARCAQTERQLVVALRLVRGHPT